ncbi:mercury methylation corrinoid protein HgcA [Thiovibrio sp. JS02]
MTGVLDTAVGPVPKVATRLASGDHWGAVRVRCGIGRMRYTIEPGLYAVGSPDCGSPVFVTANYKLSFDHLRSALVKRQAWILVLDTNGINVWCAAGKGTFATAPLVQSVLAERLAELVSHRTLILPQLAAPGVAAHLVRKECGFQVQYGPVCASHLPAYWRNGFKATRRMRRKDFPLAARAALIPVELVNAGKWAIPLMLVILFLHSLMGRESFVVEEQAAQTPLPILLLTSGIAAGSILTPLLLFILPGRAFAVKGLLAGILLNLVVFLGNYRAFAGAPLKSSAGWLLISLGVASLLGMNFTGCSTFTSLSGVQKEMRWALPPQLLAITAGSVLWLSTLF